MKLHVRIIPVLLLALLIALGAALASILFAFRVYEAFNKESLVASVSCERPSRHSRDYRLVYSPYHKGGPEQAQAFVIKGEQWMFGGDILKWKPYMNMLGLHAMHKPTRIAGRYLYEGNERNAPRAIYDLNGGTDKAWLFLYAYGRYIPFVEAVYGNSAYVFCEDGSSFDVYVTTSGYIIKKKR